MKPKSILAILAVVIAAALWYFQGPPFGSGEQKRHPASHVIHVTAKLTFDGKPVEFDELIDCKTTYRGTPTSTPHLTFKLSRTTIARETPDGGVIAVPVSRSFCFVYGNTWGDVFDEFTPPEGWSPAIEWYDHRDPRRAKTGIHYLSETALNAENSRLRIVEPFRIEIPEHPASEELIGEAAQQAAERNFWLGGKPKIAETSRFRSGRMEFMLRIHQSEWRNPQRAILSSDVGRYRAKPLPNFGALREYLDSVVSKGGVVVLPYAYDLEPDDIAAVLLRLRDGRFPQLVELYERGLPKRDAPRHGLLISEKREQRNLDNPFYPDRFDEYVPFTCIDGVMTPVPDTPGLTYWFRDRCSHPDHHLGIDFFGKAIIGEVLPPNGKLLFDPENGDLWWLNTSH